MNADIKILIVEDEWILWDELKEYLSGEGFYIYDYTPSYDIALQRIIEKSPDLIIIDIRLKGVLNGIDLANEIRAHYIIPFIFLSALSDKSIIEKARLSHPNTYLIKGKPVDKIQLLTTISMALPDKAVSNTFHKDGIIVSEPDENNIVQDEDDQKYYNESSRDTLVKFDEILWIESSTQHNYLSIVTGRKRPLSGNQSMGYKYQKKYRIYYYKSTIKDFLVQLKEATGDQFMRINRGAVVNTSKITGRKKSYRIIVNNEIDEPLTVTSDYKSAIKKYFESNYIAKKNS